MEGKPKLENAEKLTLSESDEPISRMEANGAHETHGADEADETDELALALLIRGPKFRAEGTAAA